MSFWGGRKQEQASENVTSLPAVRPAGMTTSHQPSGFDTVLGASATLKGDLKSQGNVRLDGTFEGTLEIDGNILVGETAKITADINAKNVSIAGAVRGNVSGKKVQILRTGRVWGDLTATAISTEEGCFIEGKITMITHDAAQTFDQAHFAVPDIPAPPMPDIAAIENIVERDSEAEPDAPETENDVPDDDPKDE